MAQTVYFPRGKRYPALPCRQARKGSLPQEAPHSAGGAQGLPEKRGETSGGYRVRGDPGPVRFGQDSDTYRHRQADEPVDADPRAYRRPDHSDVRQVAGSVRSAHRHHQAERTYHQTHYRGQRHDHAPQASVEEVPEQVGLRHAGREPPHARGQFRRGPAAVPRILPLSARRPPPRERTDCMG